MARLERVYNVPLRKEFQKAPRHRRSKKAIAALKAFLVRHMKPEGDGKVWIGPHLNERIWKDGIKSPPHHVRITAVKEEDGTVKAELEGYAIEKPKKEEKKGVAQKLKEAVVGPAKPTSKKPKKGEDEAAAVEAPAEPDLPKQAAEKVETEADIDKELKRFEATTERIKKGKASATREKRPVAPTKKPAPMRNGQPAPAPAPKHE
ncbi:50S ribosomal protein L31e [Candidatus Woesearchaeota archaeon]|nr:50S ribosomal protein L31e [Candidatus Woesearchaeota archaeon]